MSIIPWKAVSQMTLDDDYNIPEAMPDAGMIVQEKGPSGP